METKSQQVQCIEGQTSVAREGDEPMKDKFDGNMRCVQLNRGKLSVVPQWRIKPKRKENCYSDVVCSGR
jgi:hypothetical protein